MHTSSSVLTCIATVSFAWFLSNLVYAYLPKRVTNSKMFLNKTKFGIIRKDLDANKTESVMSKAFMQSKLDGYCR